MPDSDRVSDVMQGEGYAVGNIDAMGDGYGFRKVRRELDVSAFGINVLVMPPGSAGPAHYHERQQEVYFVHRGEIEIEFGDGSHHLLGPGSLARVDPSTVRRLHGRGSEDAVLLIAGGAEGYVGRDGKPAGAEAGS
ncbi:MAG TPA: cupin domain-containing protein [Solirubrobacteraceae bacterium]|jgi:mannose-6-phosphate isomerase-like protein (cupin superfamily)|nr:cupin domain-containing protein [Solirubrobacteraceae bacterium]